MKSISAIKEDLSGWKIEKLENIVEIHDKKRIPLNSKQRSQMKGEYPYCGANGVIDYLNDYIFDGQYLLVAEDGGFWGRGENTAYLMEGKFWANNHVHILTAIDGKAINKYLLYFFRYEDIEKHTTGTTRKKLNQTVLKRIQIPLPPLETQKKIVETLENAEKLKEWRDEADELSDEFLKSVFLEMFGDPVQNPKNWEFLKFNKVGTLQRGKSKHRPRNAPELLGGPYPLIQTGDVANSKGYINEYNQTYSELGLKQSKMWPVGTLCITIAANIAKTGILTFKACFPDSIVGFKPNEKVRTEYIQYWISFLQKILEKNAPESAQKNINLKILSDLDVPVPPIELQNQFAEIVKQVETLKTHQKKSKQQIDNLFNALMQKAFKGELTC